MYVSGQDEKELKLMDNYMCEMKLEKLEMTVGAIGEGHE